MAPEGSEEAGGGHAVTDAAQLIRSFYEGWGRGDLTAGAQRFHPDVLFKTAISETPVRGVRAAAEAVADIRTTASDWVLEFEALVAEGERVVVREHQRVEGRTSGLLLDSTLYAAFRVVDGMVTEALWYERRDDALAAAGMPVTAAI